MVKKYLTEFIGTFFLVLTIGLSGHPLAIGGIYMVMVYMGGHLSGGHYNPSVSLAVWMRGKLPLIDLAPYMLFQIAGATAAAAVVAPFKVDPFIVEPRAGVLIYNALLAETLFSFALSLVVLNVATSKATDGNSYFGLAIGFTVLVGVSAVGAISGGAFNPAVGLGPNLILGNLGHVWIYIVGPFLGAAIAAIVFRVQET
jgi:aquaporin Z